MERHSIHPSLVADVHQYVYRRTGVIGVQPEEVTEAAKKSVMENRLHRCLICGALSELHVPSEWLVPGGKLYNLAKSTHGQLRPDKNYSFPLNNVVCSYDTQRDILVPDYKLSALNTCNWCHGTSVRHIRGNGSVVYLDGDRTNTRSQGGKCGCGFKHYWEGKEYDNLPEAFPITLEWGGRVVRETVYWFQYETDPTLNSNVYDVAMKLVTKHFPGEFGSEILVQKVVNTILHHTAKKNPDEYNPVSIDGAHAQRLNDPLETQPTADPQPPTKIILTGQKAKTLHKEELTMSRAERSIQQSISEQALVSQKRRTEKLKQEQKGQIRDSSPGGSPETSSSSAPATPTKSSSPSSNKEKKIRVTTSDGRQAMLTLPAHTTFSDLQSSIANQFGVLPAQQCIRYGFPPKELGPPKDGEENEPVVLQHGDRVTVEILRGTEDTSPAASITRASSSHSSLHSAKSDNAMMSSRMSSRELQESIDLEMSSLCLLATLMGEDVWSYAKKLPHLFQQGGVFYNIVKKDMGLIDGKHCTLPHLTGKTFVYNAAEERLELCVDTAGHFPVGPDVEELVKEAMMQLRSEASTRGSREGSPSHGVLRLGSGGVVRKKEQLQNVTAFQGKGHSLGSAGGSSPPEHRPITRQHSSGVDLSASVSRGPPDLSDIPEDATRELVRMAPGFVTMKDGRGLDPGLMEQQRRKLQEMVSSIQASMERHLKEQQNASDVGGGASQNQTAAIKTITGQQGATVDQEPPAAAGPGKPEKGEELEEMESQDAGQSGATEPMDHS
uniref:ubiquitinyl hydrolase 1 n=1 Tax=Nothobranchius pienaari TaxID=704102 RepID=A0A1A8LZT1_9TELE